MDARGRSRHIADSAIARRADATKHFPTQMPHILSPVPLKHTALSPLLRTHSASTSPPSTTPDTSLSSSPDYYSSPPSPPLTLEDQVHVAYAHDDIHTAKILLLRLKGIEVTGDNDPRIAEVQDEDFDFCFVPNGGLVLDPQDEKAIQERQRTQQQRLAEHRRLERLRTCEMKWENEKRRMREERMVVLRRKEKKRRDEEQQRHRRAAQEIEWLAEHDRRKLQAEEDMFVQRTRIRSDRKVLSYTILGSTSTATSPSPLRTSWSDEGTHHIPSLFTYDCMASSRKYRFSDDTLQRGRFHRDTPSTSRFTISDRQPLQPFDDSFSIPFSDVLKSMQGELFPVTNEERRARARRKESPSPSASQPRSKSQIKRMRENVLIHHLLDNREDQEDERRTGKNKAVPHTRRRSSSDACLACRSTSPSSAGSRLSWLSFGGSASTSSSSVATTPPSSPSPSFRTSGTFKLAEVSRSRRLSWIPSATSFTRATSTSRPSVSCYCSDKNLVPVELADTPLSPFSPPTYAPPPPATKRRKRAASLVAFARGGAAKELVQSVSSTLADLVTGFQQSYISVAKFSVAANADGDRWDERRCGFKENISPLEDREQRPTQATVGNLKPHGRRVSPKDVARFLVTDSSEEWHRDLPSSPSNHEAPDVIGKTRVSTSSIYTDIPLSSPYGAAAQGPPRTVLPNPLPYKLGFQPLPVTPRSPFRLNAFSHLQTPHPNSFAPKSDDADVIEGAWANNEHTVSPVVGVQLPAWRIRSVGNPVYLRIKALQNVVTAKSIAWQGFGREMGLGGGRERIPSVAFEGLGCSRLARSSFPSSY